MTTIVAVKKNGFVAIAADTLTKFGSVKESHNFISNNEKIMKFKDNYLGFTGSSAFKLVVEHWLANLKQKPKFDSVANIFETWLSFHTELKENYFLRPEDEDFRDFETSRMNLLIANPKGIFAVGELRTVLEYKTFTAFGSGYEFAVGAMQAIYEDESKSAEDVARIGLEVAAEFDDGTALPMHCYTVKLK